MSFPEVDLHGLTLDEALADVERELNHSFIQKSEDRRLAFITGQGKVLRPSVEKYLVGHPLVKETRIDGGVLQVVLEEYQ